jgi:hypothetical protein
VLCYGGLGQKREKNKQMDIVLTANKRGVNFSITGGFELITVDDFKIRAVVNGKSKGISSSISIWIGSTESTNKKVVTLVIGKSDLTIDNAGTVDPDIGRSFIV